MGGGPSGNYFAGPMAQNKRLGQYLRSNLYSDYIPGQTDVMNTFTSALSAPFTRQYGGGVEDIGYRNQLLQDERNPAMSNLVQQNLANRNWFADMLTQTGAQGNQMYAMQLMLKTLQDQLGLINSQQMQQAVGSLGSGFGFTA